MSSFNESIERMKALYSYGRTDESKKQSTSTLEYSVLAADGKTYGIVRECNHYFIKQASKGKENIAEGYDYIGGYMNKNNYRYDSYNNALKNLELKLASINEAHDAKVNITTLDPFKKENLVIEGTEKMKDEIARQRQIMYNASMIMNESIGIGNVGTPEAPKGSNDADKPFTEKAEAKLDVDLKETASEPKKQGAPFGDSKAPEKGKDVKDSDVTSDGKCVAAEHPSGGKVVRVNEECEDGKCDWGSEGLGKGKDPKTIGWDMEGDKQVNEEEEIDIEDDDVEDDSLVDDSGVDVPESDEENFEDFEDEEDVDFDEEETDVDLDDEIEDEDEEEPLDVEDDFEENDIDESDPESVRAEIERLQGILDELGSEEESVEGEEEIDTEAEVEEPFESEEEIDAESEVEEPFEGEDFEEEEEEEDEFSDFIPENKKKFFNSIVESVVKTIKEEQLHDFGKHPGYRKKPMTTPPVGQDKNQWGEDWNDESTHNEKPFGEEIGDGKPFTEKVINAVTEDVVKKLKKKVK